MPILPHVCRAWRALRFPSTVLACLLAAAAGATDERPSEGEVVPGTGRPRRIYHATRLPGAAPVVDGRLDDACWRDAGAWSGGFVQLTPKHGAPPAAETEIKILFDDRNLYVAMRAHDGPVDQRVILPGDRDEFAGDGMGVSFDSYRDQRTGFEFDLTAAGQKIDLRLGNSDVDTTWNAVWDGKVSHDAAGWSAEFRIPLSQLRYAAGNGVWGLHAWRWIDRLKEESDWNLLANDGSGTVKSFGELRGLEGLPSPRRVELLPYTALAYETFGQRGTAQAARRRTTLRGGVDAKIGLSSNITLDASLYPDFGQVESDPAVMNLSAYETFLEERRPLFLEGKDIFAFPFGEDEYVFYSRRIGQAPSLRPPGTLIEEPAATTLLGALKVSGKTARGLSLGVLAAATDEEAAGYRDGGGTHTMAVEPATTFLVARAQQDFRGGDTAVGGIVTAVRRAQDTPQLKADKARQALVAGADFMHHWNDRRYFAHAVVLGSAVEGDAAAITKLQRTSARYYQRPIDGATRLDPTRESLEGTAFWLEAGKGSGGRWRYSGQWLAKSSGFELNDAGFMTRADRHYRIGTLRFVEKEPGRFLRNYDVRLKVTDQATAGGERIGTNGEIEFKAELANKWYGEAEFEVNTARRDPVALRGGPMLRLPAYRVGNFFVMSDESRPFAFRWYGWHVDYDHAVFRETGWGGRLSWRPWQTVLLSLSGEYTDTTDRTRHAPVRADDGSTGWFVSRLDSQSLSLAVRAQWIIRPELRLQYYGNPFGSTGRHAEFRRVASPEAARFADRYGPVLGGTLAGPVWRFDEDGDGRSDHSIGDPEWNDASFRSNLVLKWEYRPGSMLYLVWSQQRAGATADRTIDAVDALQGVRHYAPNNQFLLKLTYWFTL